MILGYSVFYIMFKGQCTNLLVEMDRSHNKSHATLETKYSRAMTEIQKCQDDTFAREKTKELEGRLQAQAALSDKHQDLLGRHERTLEKISELQKTSEGSISQINALKEEIRFVQQSLDESTEQLRTAKAERDDIQQDIQQQMAQTNKVLREREQENMELREFLDNCDEKIKNTEGKFRELQNLVQQQNYASIIAMFGEGPYIVRFNLEFPYEPVEPNWFEVKIFNARDMPHTVLTFLNMVDNGLYVDTTIDFVKNKVIQGGSLGSVEPQLGKNMKTTVLRRFANFGYSAHNTMFFEGEQSHNAPCRHSSFGINGRGPGFVIYLTNEVEGNPTNCPGVVVKGRDTLERLMHAHTNSPNGGELTWKVPIVATYLVSLEDEL